MTSIDDCDMLDTYQKTNPFLTVKKKIAQVYEFATKRIGARKATHCKSHKLNRSSRYSRPTLFIIFIRRLSSIISRNDYIPDMTRDQARISGRAWCATVALCATHRPAWKSWLPPTCAHAISQIVQSCLLVSENRELHSKGPKPGGITMKRPRRARISREIRGRKT